MTLGEFAIDIANEISDRADRSSEVRGVIGEAAQLLGELPASQMRWFWQTVAGQLTAHRPIEEGEQAEHITEAINEVMQAMTACGIGL